MNNSIAVPVLLMLFMGSVQAVENKPLLDKNKVSIAGGIVNNSVSGPVDDEFSVQFFGVYDLNQVRLIENVDTSIELGYMDYGFPGPDSGGLWVNAVIDGAFNQAYGWLARFGLDLGDDSGLMFGAGLSFSIDTRTRLRLEYVARDEIDSLQLNLVYHL
ncbi:MAG: hypothetical protein OEY43_01895 [Gammaproteobacteria bacterium]|nr:hypothetical protein [Gammaproteobacteria bacterium]